MLRTAVSCQMLTAEELRARGRQLALLYFLWLCFLMRSLTFLLFLFQEREASTEYSNSVTCTNLCPVGLLLPHLKLNNIFCSKILFQSLTTLTKHSSFSFSSFAWNICLLPLLLRPWFFWNRCIRGESCMYIKETIFFMSWMLGMETVSVAGPVNASDKNRLWVVWTPKLWE